jgi:small subunit ribosomal protein S20
VANIKQQIKRNRRALTQRERNIHYRSTIRTLFRRVDEALDGGDAEAAAARTAELEKLIDKAAGKGVIHRNTAARRKRRLARMNARQSEGASA